MKLLSRLNQRFDSLYQRFENKYFRLSDSQSLATQNIRDLAPYLIKRTTPTKKALKIEENLAKDFLMPFVKNDAFIEYMQKFMYSFKNIYPHNINIGNVLFLTGPTKAGKSWFLRYNLRKFENSSQKPIIFHYNFKEQGILSFDMFLFSFEKMIMDKLVERNNIDLQEKGKSLITDKDLLKVIFRFYDENLFEQDLARCIDKATNNYSMTAGFQINNQEDKKNLRILLDKYRNRDFKETPLLDNFEKIAQIIAQSYNGDLFKAKLLMVYDVLLRKEQEKKPSYYVHTSNFRNGLDVMNFLFDLINHIGGYSDKYYDEIEEKGVTHEDLVKKYRVEHTKHNQDINKSDLLGDKFTHCLLAFEGIQELYRMKGCGKFAIDYFDSLILRLHNGSDVWYRNHFPVIMESNMSYYFNEQIYNDVQQPEFFYPTVEMLGFDQSQRAIHMDRIFNKDQMKLIDKALGRSIYFLSVFTEQKFDQIIIKTFYRIAKARREDQTFENLLQLQHPAFDKIKNELRYRLNKLYTHPLLGDLLDSGDIDYAILDVLEQLGNKKNLILNCTNEYMQKEFLLNPIIQVLLDQNILYKSKYYNILYIEHALYQPVIKQFAEDKLQNMTTAERMRFTMYKKIYGLKFGSMYSGANRLRDTEVRNKTRAKQTRIFDPYELYFEDITPEQMYVKFFS